MGHSEWVTVEVIISGQTKDINKFMMPIDMVTPFIEIN